MSFIPAPYLVRLQELKLWQGNYDNLLQKSKSQNVTDCSDLDDIDDLTPKVDAKSTPTSSPFRCEPRPIDWDQKAISPSKPFTELLEEKMAEDQPNELLNKPKKPFLKKGSGLARFNLNTNLPSTKTKNQLKSKPNRVAPKRELPVQQIVKEELTPLKVPDISIKCMASWSRVDHNGKEFIPSQKNVCENIVEKISEVSLNNILTNNQRNNDEFNGDETNQSERDLHLFEVLEEKVEHSSFSSTNSSIRRLLSSTPNSKHSFDANEQQDNSEVLTKLLQNLKLFSQKKSTDNLSDIQTNKSSTNTSFSDAEGEKWCPNSDSHTPTLSSFYTEFENTLGKPETADAGVNTSYVEKSESTQTQYDQCYNCVELRKKLERLERERPDITVEKAKLCDFAKELEKKRDQLNQETENLKKTHSKDIEDLREELEKERIKFSREKALLDMYLKDPRPSKTDREQVENLKKEIIDIKELMKLKETKNGTTQARLRNQIKQLEKEKNELKTKLESLQKENSKLNASSKVNRNAENKMLQEINKNLHRLTEETKQLNKSDTPINKENENNKQQNKIRRKSMGDIKDKSGKEYQTQLNKTSNVPITGIKREENPTRVEVIYDNESGLSDLEKQYESAFGLHIDSEDHIANADNRKKSTTIISEKQFPDGSQEIKYSNGASKIISPDRNCIYVQYANGDIKETNLIKNMKKFYFIAQDVWLTKYSDGIELAEFPNGQKEKKYPDGRLEVTTADGTLLITSPGGTQEINYPDGSRMVNAKNEKIIYLPNGQKETHKDEYKKREYPDGTVKILYPDGTQESRYANGRVRIKDADGTLIVDSQIYK